MNLSHGTVRFLNPQPETFGLLRDDAESLLVALNDQGFECFLQNDGSRPIVRSKDGARLVDLLWRGHTRGWLIGFLVDHDRRFSTRIGTVRELYSKDLEQSTEDILAWLNSTEET